MTLECVPTVVVDIERGKAIAEVIKEFQLQEVQGPISNKNTIPLSERQMGLVKNEKYFSSEENVLRIRYTLKMDTLPADKVIELFEKLTNMDKDVIFIYKFLINKFGIQHFVWKNGKWTLPEWNYSCLINWYECDFSEFLSEYSLSDLYFDSYKQVYEIPYDVLVKKRKKFNEILSGSDKIYTWWDVKKQIFKGQYFKRKDRKEIQKSIKSENLYYKWHLIDPDTPLYLNVWSKTDKNMDKVLCFNEGDCFGVIDFFTPGGLLLIRKK